MDTPLNSIEFLSRSSHRVAILDALIETPRERSELRETVGASSSTVGRVLGEFTDRGWIARVGHRYEPTPMGRFIGREFTRLLTTMETVEQLDDVMAWFPTEEMDFDLRALGDATVTRATRSNPFMPMLRMAEEVGAAEDVRLLVYAAIPQTLTAAEEMVEGAGTFEGVVTTEAFDTIVADEHMCSSFREILATDGVEIFRYDGDVPYNIALTDDRASIGVSDEQQLPRALVTAADETVVSWAESTYESYRRDSKPIGPDELGG